MFGSWPECEHRDEKRRVAACCEFKLNISIFAFPVDHGKAAGLMVSCNYDESVRVFLCKVEHHIDSFVKVAHLVNKIGGVVVMSCEVDL